MGNWRRRRGQIYRTELKDTRSYNEKPPLDNCGYSVPAWEKRFCSSIGSVPWRKVLETKKYMYLYDDVLKWNDSASEEAFHNAKRRFWAKLNRLPCNISLPDPDIYIDEVDWNASVNPDLLYDLERDPEAPVVEDADEMGESFRNSLGLDQSFWCTGWGEAEEDLQKPPCLSLGPQYDRCDQNVDNGENHWGYNCAQSNGAEKIKERDKGWNSSLEWDNWGD